MVYETSEHKIVYAADKMGTMLGNNDVGQIKRNLITWDHHLQQNWEQYLTPNGQWKYGDATRGRAAQRNTLLEKVKDTEFEDPFPDGNQFLNIGPPLNVIHPVDDYTDDEDTDDDGKKHEGPSPRPQVPGQGLNIPGTRISQDFSHIKISAYKDWHTSSIRVVRDFLKGRMAEKLKSNFTGYEDLQVDRVESAFYHQGWRVDRRAVWLANREVRHGLVRRAIDAESWKDNPPMRYHLLKWEEVEQLMNDLKIKDDDESSDDDNYGRHGRSGSGPGDGDVSHGFDEEESDRNSLFISDR